MKQTKWKGNKNVHNNAEHKKKLRTKKKIWCHKSKGYDDVFCDAMPETGGKFVIPFMLYMFGMLTRWLVIKYNNSIENYYNNKNIIISQDMIPFSILFNSISILFPVFIVIFRFK